MNNEKQNIEFKSIWKDEYLKWISGFANADGGSIIIGKNDNGTVVGIIDYQKLLVDLPNKISNILGITVDVNLYSEDNKYFIEIIIEPYSNPISYKGRFYYRTGSTMQELKGPALEKLLLKKMGKKWDGVVANNFSINDLDDNAFDIFRQKARRGKRIPNEDINDTNSNILEALNLTTENKLKRAAVISFGKNPEKLITGSFIKIGYFRTHADLMYQDEIHGSLFEQVEKTMDLLLTKYLKANIAYDGLTRTETYDYPEEALREALLNAVIHKDYSSSIPIQISVYNDWLMIYNNGDLPKGWTIKKLKQKHSSQPANPDIARTFFRAGYIEVWGRGTINIVNYCKKANLPEPTYDDQWGGIAVIFSTNKTQTNEDRFNQNYGIVFENTTQEIIEATQETSITTQETIEATQEKTNRSMEILELIKQNPNINRQEIAKVLGDITEDGVKYHLSKLKQQGVLERVGSSKAGHWNVINSI